MRRVNYIRMNSRRRRRKCKLRRWKMEAQNFVTTLLVTLFVIPHHHHISPFSTSKISHTTSRNRPKQ
jgi:hypothetical protein